MVAFIEANTLEDLIAISRDFGYTDLNVSAEGIVWVRVLPRIRSDKAKEALRQVGGLQFVEHDQILDFCILRKNRQIYFKLESDFHESWQEGYKSYVEHVQEEVVDLRKKGFTVEYRHFDATRGVFVNS